MKTIIRLILVFGILILFTPKIYSQCGIVEENSFSTTFVDNLNDTCTWTITFVVCNHSSAGNSSLKYSLIADDLGFGVKDTINPMDEVCDVCNIVYPGWTVTNTYKGSCDVVFNLEWGGYADPECHGDHYCESGSETTETPTSVELVDFKGTLKNGTIKLNWETESESNNHFFEVQRSHDAKTFENIGMVEGSGDSETSNYYNFVDRNPLSFAYYRLKQVDFDGRFDFSYIISVKGEAFDSKLMAYPTQAYDYIIIKIETLNSRKSYLKIANIAGQVMYEKTYYIPKEIDYMTLDVNDFPAGLYFVSLSNKMNTITTKFTIAKN